MRRTYYLYTFDSTHAAIAAQRLLKETDAALMPTLRAITASCGMSLRISCENVDRARALMAASDIDAALYTLYRVEQEDGGIRCEKVPEKDRQG